MESSAPAVQSCAGCGAPFVPTVVGQTLCDRCQGLHIAEASSPLQETYVSGYRLVQEIGAGRFSTSWLANDPDGRNVVLKLLRRYAPDPNSVQRFLAEAQRLAGAPELSHPHIARLLNGGVHVVQALFLVYDAGGESTLADELRARGRMQPRRALEVCAQIAEALAVIHRAGIAHLDLKPANVGMTELANGKEQAILLDFATAHLLTKSGIVDPDPLPLSTAAYLAPEAKKDGRSDVYALGALLFHLITGRLPVEGASADELAAAHRDHPTMRLHEAGRRVHEDLEMVVFQLLAKNPAQRPSMDEVAILLRAVAAVADVVPLDAHAKVAAAPPPPPPPQMAAVGQFVLPPQLVEREPIDPALERAFMGEIGPQPEETPPGLPAWAPRVWPAWVRPAAAGGAVRVVALAIALWPSKKNVAPPPPPAPVTRRTRAQPPPKPVVQEPAPKVEEPPPPVAKADPRPQIGDSSPKIESSADGTPAAKMLDRAQNAVWAGKPYAAESILRKVLKHKDLSRRDKARAEKLMGDAALKRGSRPGAAVWYHRALRSADDAAYKDRIRKALAAVEPAP